MEKLMNSEKNFDPLIIDFKCRYCGFECEMVALNGVESDTIQCPDCERRIAKDGLQTEERD